MPRIEPSHGAPFIVFEGLDGSGKSTLMRSLEERIERRGLKVLLTREPGGTPLAEEIRGQLLRRDGDTPVPRAELFLYEAARAQHVERIIRPALNGGVWVLCDRFYASTVAFQVGGRGLDGAMVAALNTMAIAGVEPDLWVLLDLSVQESRRRQGVREGATGEGKDRFEVETDAFHERVRANYLEQAHADPRRWLVLDSARTAPTLVEDVELALMERGWLS